MQHDEPTFAEEEDAAISRFHSEQAQARAAARSSRRLPPQIRDEDYVDHGQGD